MKRLLVWLIPILPLSHALLAGQAGDAIPVRDLLLDLDADHGLTLEDADRVSAWTNQIKGAKAVDFVKRDQGRTGPGSGRPVLREAVKELNGHAALVFRQGELVNMEEDVFDGLTTGKGFTWICVLAVYQQRVGLKDVNSFFGNLRNGGRYEGLWGCVRDDNTLWTGARNGITFGRFDENNPEVVGPALEKGKFHIVASRMGSGTGKQTIELFVNGTEAVAEQAFPVTPDANPSRMAVGQERDAVEHPGKESFDGEIARLLIYQRPLGDAELSALVSRLRKKYGL